MPDFSGISIPTVFMLPVSPVFHTEVTVNIGLKNIFRVGTSIPSMSMLVGRGLKALFYSLLSISQTEYQTEARFLSTS